MIMQIAPPEDRYDLKRIIIGESSTVDGTPIQVASSLIVGSFPTWITTYDYPDASSSYYYSAKWEYNNGGFSDWYNKVIGRTGQSTNYIIINAPSVSSIYIMVPASGDSPTLATTWMDYNKEYYITIDKSLSGVNALPMSGDYVLTFTSEYCPHFVSVLDVRYEAGDFINNLTDDTINRIIYKNSDYIIARYYNEFGGMPSNYTCNGISLNTAFRRYVLCKSALDGITAIQLSMGSRTLKKLADVTFEYGGTNTKADPISKKKDLKDCIDSTLAIIFSGKNFQIAVRGRYFSPQPHPMYDPSYGRLSLPNRNWQYNMASVFDQLVLGDAPTGTGLSHSNYSL